MPRRNLLRSLFEVLNCIWCGLNKWFACPIWGVGEFFALNEWMIWHLVWVCTLWHSDWKETPCGRCNKSNMCVTNFPNAMEMEIEMKMDKGSRWQREQESGTTISGNSHSPAMLISVSTFSLSPSLSLGSKCSRCTGRRRLLVQAERVYRIWLWSIIPFSTCLQTHHRLRVRPLARTAPVVGYLTTCWRAHLVPLSESLTAGGQSV